MTDRDWIILKPAKRKPGRPRKAKPEPPSSPTITIWDRRSVDQSKFVVQYDRVPSRLSVAETIKLYGIAEHFTVVRKYPGEPATIIQQGSVHHGRI